MDVLSEFNYIPSSSLNAFEIAVAFVLLHLKKRAKGKDASDVINWAKEVSLDTICQAG